MWPEVAKSHTPPAMVVSALEASAAEVMPPEAQAVPAALTTLTPICADDVLTADPATSTMSVFTRADPALPVKLSGCVVPTLTLNVTLDEQVTACVLIVWRSAATLPVTSVLARVAGTLPEERLT